MKNFTTVSGQKAASLLIAIAITLTISGCSSNKATHSTMTAVQKNQTNLGVVLTDNAGMTLYTFGKDQPNVSNCNNGCSAKWPPLLAQNSAVAKGRFTVIKRADNSKQWAVDGKPLYRWVKDKIPGDTTGEGIKSVWFAAKP